MSTQQKEIIAIMKSDPAWEWSYDDLQAVLEHIAPDTMRKQMSRLVSSGRVSRVSSGAFRLAETAHAESAETGSQTADDSRDSTRDNGRAETASQPHDGPTGAPVSPDSRSGADGGTGASAGTGEGASAPPHDARAGARPGAGAGEGTGVGTGVGTGTRASSSPSLLEHDGFAAVLDALPVPCLASAMRVAAALAFVRSQLSGCEAPALAIAGSPGTGKSVLYKSLSILLHGDTDAVTDARTLTSAQQIIGRREKKDGVYTAIPSVLLQPPDRPAPQIVVLDEIGEASSSVLQGASLILRLEDRYWIESVEMPMRSLLGFAYNKGSSHRGRLYHPWSGWDGATRRMLIVDLDHSSDYLKRGAAKTAARRIFAALEKSSLIDLSAYRDKARAPTPALLESADVILGEVFCDASELPLGDPVLKGLTMSYAALYDYPLERALLAALADVAMMVGTLPGLLLPGAEKALNARLRSAGLAPVALPKVAAPKLGDDDTMSLSPQARARIAAHLARASTRSTDELLQTLCEYNLARRRRCWIRVPRFALELVGRLLVAFVFTLFAALQNIAIAPALKLPRVGGAVVAGVWGWGSSPRTCLAEYVDMNGSALSSPRAYCLKLFGDDMTARAAVQLEDEIKAEDVEPRQVVAGA